MTQITERILFPQRLECFFFLLEKWIILEEINVVIARHKEHVTSVKQDFWSQMFIKSTFYLRHSVQSENFEVIYLKSLVWVWAIGSDSS